MSDTPRTDKMSYETVGKFSGRRKRVVAASFACDLERELAACTKQLEIRIGAMIDRNLARAERDEERALADRLAGSLQDIASQHLADEMDDHSSEHADWEGGYEAIVKIAREALAAWKEARDE